MVTGRRGLAEQSNRRVVFADFRAGRLENLYAKIATRLKERGARLILASLVEQGILGSDTPKGAVSLRFPSDAVDLLFPRLFAETYPPQYG